VGPDDNIQGTRTDIRPAEEVKAWVQKDPINSFKDHLIKCNLITPVQLDQIASEVDTEIREAYQFTRNSPFPQSGELMHYVCT